MRGGDNKLREADDWTSQSARMSAELYIENCQRFNVPIDPSIVIALQTEWHIIMPSKSFGEGGMLPLMGGFGGKSSHP